MFLIRSLFWLVTLPIRLVLWVLGLALWLLTLPIRIPFKILSLIGFMRVVQLGILGALGYFFYRLVNPGSTDMEPRPASDGPPSTPPPGS